MLKMYQDPTCFTHERPHWQYTKLFHVEFPSLVLFGTCATGICGISGPLGTSCTSSAATATKINDKARRAMLTRGRTDNL